LLAAAVATLLLPGPVQACSCGFPPLRQRIADAETAFVGTVISVQRPWLDTDEARTLLHWRTWTLLVDLLEPTVVTTFRVDLAIKGVHEPTIAIHSEPYRCCLCEVGIFAQPGERLLLLPHPHDDRLEIGMCSFVRRTWALTPEIPLLLPVMTAGPR